MSVDQISTLGALVYNIFFFDSMRVFDTQISQIEKLSSRQAISRAGTEENRVFHPSQQASHPSKIRIAVGGAWENTFHLCILVSRESLRH